VPPRAIKVKKSDAMRNINVEIRKGVRAKSKAIRTQELKSTEKGKEVFIITPAFR
jgi:hypothetical protein